LRNSDHAFDSSHHATNHTAHHGTNHSADRTGRVLTYGGALLASTNNALGLRRKRNCKSGNDNDGHGELHLHEQTPPLEICGFDDRRGDLIPALWRHREANAATIDQNRSGSCSYVFESLLAERLVRRNVCDDSGFIADIAGRNHKVRDGKGRSSIIGESMPEAK
jgi:hypothetical protein